MLFEGLITKRKRHDFNYLIIHYLCIIMGINVFVFLPNLHLLSKRTGFVSPVCQDRFEGLNDSRYLTLFLGFLGKDDRIYRLFFLYRLYVFGKDGTYEGSDVSAGRIDGHMFAVIL